MYVCPWLKSTQAVYLWVWVALPLVVLQSMQFGTQKVKLFKFWTMANSPSQLERRAGSADQRRLGVPRKTQDSCRQELLDTFEENKQWPPMNIKLAHYNTWLNKLTNCKKNILKLEKRKCVNKKSREVSVWIADFFSVSNKISCHVAYMVSVLTHYDSLSFDLPAEKECMCH